MIYKITQPSLLYGDLIPAEDSMMQIDNVFCVADGVTRDPKSPKDFSNKKPEEILKKYPNPSGAKLVADVFCKSFSKTVLRKSPTMELVKKAFIAANNNIAKINKKHIHNVDYLVNDFYGCVASGGVILGNKLYWGGISDCGIIVFDKNGKVKFQTENWMSDFVDYENKYLKTRDFNWAKPKYRKMIRSEFRNNSTQIINEKLVSYGVLTGEKTATAFMNFGEVKLDKKDLIVFYTDGFEDTIKRKDFFKKIYSNTMVPASNSFLRYTSSLAKKDYHKFGRERTLISVINN